MLFYIKHTRRQRAHFLTHVHTHMSTGSGRAGVECGDQASPERGVLPGGQGGGCCREEGHLCVRASPSTEAVPEDTGIVM